MAAPSIIVSVLGSITDLQGKLGTATNATETFAKDAEGHSGRVSAAFGKTGDAIGKAAMVGAAGVATGGIAIAGALFKVGSDFDDAYDKIRIGTGATGGELDSLKGIFNDVVSTVPASFGDASDAVTTLTERLGKVTDSTPGLASQMLELSRITGTDLKTNINSAEDAFGNWGVKVSEQGPKLDELFRASQKSGVAVADLSSTVGKAGPTMRALGFSFEQTTAMAAQMGKAGVDVDAVFGGMKKSLSSLAKAGEDPKTTFMRLTEEIKNTKDPIKASQEAMALFGAKAGPQMAQQIREGKLEYGDMLKAITGGKDTIIGAGKETADFGEKWTLIKNRVFVALQPVASKVFDLVGAGMDKLSAALPTITAGFERIGPLFTKAGALIGDAIGMVSGLFSGAGGTVDSVSTKMGGTLDKLGGVWRSLVAVVGPAMDAIKSIVMAVVTVLTDLWDRFGNTLIGKLQVAFNAITQVVKGALEIVKGIFEVFAGIFTGDWGKLWQGIKDIFGGIWNAFLGVFKAAWDSLSLIFEAFKAVMSAAWSLLWNSIQTAFGVLWSGISGAVTGAFDAIVNWFTTTAPTNLRNNWAALWNGVKDMVAGLWGGITSAVTGAWNGIVSFFTSAPEAIARVTGGLFDGIKNAFKAAINFIINGWNTLHFGIPSIDTHIPGIGKIGGFDVGVPHINPLAMGGIVRARPGGILANIGEGQHDEAVIPLPAGMRNGGSLGGENVTINVTVNGSVLSERELGEVVNEALIAYRRRSGGLGLTG